LDVPIALGSGKSLLMDTGEWLTRATVWLALSLYVTGEIVRVCGLEDRSGRLARVLNSLGCAAFVAHFVCAFHFHHHWSHDAAYAETARRTANYFGWNWGGGLYFNYAFLLLWVIQSILSWIKPHNSAPGKGWPLWMVRGFVLMMIVNGAVVFVRGPMKWFGMLLCLALIWSWWPRREARE
jgi:hypothetical protein